MSAPHVDPQGDVASLLAAAERALSDALGREIRLGESAPLTERGRRNAVLRCRNLSGGSPSSFIIKKVAAERYDPRDTASWEVRRFFSGWVGGSS
jgi:hypothetical protein